MNLRMIVFVYNSSPLLGRSPPITGGIFSWFSESKYIKKLNEDIISARLPWQAILDPGEADSEVIKQIADVIVCAPGLKYQFFKNGFDGEKIIYLSTMEYAASDTQPVLKLIRALSR
ncbi:hypothetical protein [Erwinia mallotivora]|uniref:Nitrogen fixation protein NifS n=1 Tax=Erwinia mallotivora TaxID=69222 RepID=A0A014PRU2_9GAMM|nr:hypothetical protein [Erwinia mallotivora]EXU73612.1 nitrogen fixation protein NifS [Erwinia mallotivora]